jgi:hypothetical protein
LNSFFKFYTVNRSILKTIKQPVRAQALCEPVFIFPFFSSSAQLPSPSPSSHLVPSSLTRPVRLSTRSPSRLAAVAASSRRDPDADPRRSDRPRSVRPRPRLPSPVPIAFDSLGFLGASRRLAPDLGVLVRGLVIVRPTRRTSAR